MKYLLRVFLFNSFSLWLVSQLFPALVVVGGWQNLLFAGFILTLLMLLISPILKILLIPVNLLTFGLFSWASNVVVLYLLTLFVPDVTVTVWQFPGVSYSGLVIAPFLISYPLALVLVSFALSFVTNFLHNMSES